MSLINVIPPASATNIFEEKLAQLGELFLKNATTIDNKPHAVYQIELDDLIKTKKLNNAVLVAWRYFTNDDKSRLGVHEIRVKQNEAVYNDYNFGNSVDNHYQLLKEEFENPKLKNYQHNFLRIPSLRTRAIWYKSATGGKDYFHPLRPYFYGLEENKLYTEAEFIKILLKAAIIVKKQYLKIATDNLL